MDDFDIIGRKDVQGFSDSWRVFGRDYSGSTEGFPRATSLQRGFADWLDAGHKTGTGYGVIVFDGERIVNK